MYVVIETDDYPNVINVWLYKTMAAADAFCKGVIEANMADIKTSREYESRWVKVYRVNDRHDERR